MFDSLPVSFGGRVYWDYGSDPHVIDRRKIIGPILLSFLTAFCSQINGKASHQAKIIHLILEGSSQ